MTMSNNCAVILAGGEGKRMHSPLPKVLCPVLGRPMLDYVVKACGQVVSDLCVVVGFKGDMVKQHLGGRCETAVQAQQLGTGHAVMQAGDFLARHRGGQVLVVCGDAPLMDAQTLSDALRQHETERNAVTVITASLSDPASYGRVVKDNGRVTAIVEYKDCTPDQRAITEINSGAYWFSADALPGLLAAIDNDNAQREYYLTDTIKLALQKGLPVGAFCAAHEDVVMGANDPEQLALLNERAAVRFGAGQ